jgi:hypothetical protein
LLARYRYRGRFPEGGFSVRWARQHFDRTQPHVVRETPFTSNRIVSNREHFGVPFHAIFDARGQLLIDSESPVGNIGHPSSFEGRRHLTKMLGETRQKLTESKVEQIVGTLED